MVPLGPQHVAVSLGGAERFLERCAAPGAFGEVGWKFVGGVGLGGLFRSI